jgi:large subunit ribosomal protein L10
MPLNKAQKQKIIEDLKEKIGRQKIMIFLAIAGLKVKDLFELRKRLEKVEAQLNVAKKTLLRIAFQEKKTNIDPQKLEGEVAVVFGYQNELSPAKVIYQFSRENKNIKILGGYLESQKQEFLDEKEIITLAELPAREELEARLVYGIFAPVSNFVNVLQGNIKGLISVLAQVKTEMTNDQAPMTNQ